MLDRDLAKLYGVETRVLNQAVKRNLRRFPEDFMFKLTGEEVESLRSQFVTLNKSDRILGRGKHRKYLPYVFTEQGVAMLSSVLNSSRAIQVNIRIMRAFVELRYALSLNSRFDIKLKELESRIDSHDNNISDIFEAIRQLVGIPHERRKIKGFAS
ncbi:MAG: ORF6N domain-containing protein [Candidatus Omnitrophica bacterium]|jgi:phage regulator Rha-like protein|nr:ORF6N domain-containing protein [Candidatus Omnitrophota bacterium]